MGREIKKFLKGGIEQEESFSDQIFLKKWGTTKKIKEGDVEMKNIRERYEFLFLR